jgi:hypothetical protein
LDPSYLVPKEYVEYDLMLDVSMTVLEAVTSAPDDDRELFE